MNFDDVDAPEVIVTSSTPDLMTDPDHLLGSSARKYVDDDVTSHDSRTTYDASEASMSAVKLGSESESGKTLVSLKFYL